MPTHASAYWTDDRIAATVDRAFILAQLTPDERRLLGQSISFGGGLTDDTYLDWILERAKRFFLILVEIGVPDQIFGLVDESYDDADLPIALNSVPDLRLTQDPDRNLDKKFYKTQFKFLIREITEGQNLQYTEEETIPVETVGLKAGIVPLGKDGTDKVRLASNQHQVYARKRVPLNQPPHHVSEADVLSEIHYLRKLAHQHLASVYASYLHGDSIYVLLTPASEYTLKAFVVDTPKQFENLPKSERREILINWPHCLANGLDWLHTKGVAHGAVRPSNVLLDARFRIFLGQSDSFNITYSNFKADQVEIYQYAAPERWKRSAKMQTFGPGKVALPSGGRTGRKQSDSRGSANTADGNRNWSNWAQTRTSTPRSSLDTVKPTPAALPLSPSSNMSSPGPSFDRQRAQYEASFTSSSSSGVASAVASSASGDHSQPLAARQRAHTQSSQTGSVTASIVTTDTSGNSNAVWSALREPIILAPPEIRTTIVQTWHSADFDPLAADIFGLGAVITDILTMLCKRGSSSFSRFRSAKNRTAGRGGGLADASFHANIGQVLAWLALLVHDARKKAPKADGRVFRAVEPMVDLLRACLEREPEDRVKAHELEKRLGDCVWHSANIGKLHCYKALQALAPPKSPPGTADRQRTGLIVRTLTKPRETIHQDVSHNPSTKHVAAHTNPNDRRVRHELPSEPESSTSSLSFNFDYELNTAQSDAGLDEDHRNIGPDHNGKHHGKRPGVAKATAPASQVSPTQDQRRSWDNWHNNDSSIDPTLISSKSHPGKVYTNFLYEPSSSDEGGQKSFLLPGSRRGSMVPAPAPAPAPAPVRRDLSNPHSGSTKSDDPYDAPLRTSADTSHVPGKATTVAKEKVSSRNISHQPNTSRTRTNRSMELLKVDVVEQSMRSGEVHNASHAVPAHITQSRGASANFSRPRFPRPNPP